MGEPFDHLRAALSDRYVLERELGSGGMATVYLAHDPRHNRKVAIKVMRPEVAAVIGSERFLKEIETTANLQHPHILPLFDSGRVEGTVFYVMPYVQGESLRTRLTRDTRLRPTAGSELWTVPLRGRAVPTRYLANGFNLAHPAISPDGLDGLRFG
jgi:serine/threonine protein kinase